MASSSTSSNQKSFKYHVFLSFRGEDTRKTFVDHLYASLKQKGIHTFRDNEELEKGKRIEELFKAIEESRLLTRSFMMWSPVTSANKVGQLEEQSPNIRPTNRLRNGKRLLKVQAIWLAGDLKNIANGHEAEGIKTIVKEISFKLWSIHLSNDENVIGMDHRMQELESSLGIGLNDKVRMIGIKGMGGIGKTTLARAIFDNLSSHFEGSIFVGDVREVSKKKGLESLQEQILSGVLNDAHMRVGSVHDGKEFMRMRLPYKKVLLVLDDVDDEEQLEALAGDWFKDGSRIIITTRDEKVLLAHGVDTNWIHDVDFFSDEEAMSLFSRYAFKRYIPDQGYEELSLEVVRYVAGLPLTVKVLGSHLRGEKKLVWSDALKRLKTIPSRKTLEVLEISYNSLEDDHKEMFLDIACFLKGSPEEYAIKILDSCGFHATYGLRVLEQKSLITISYNRLGMHDRIEELGWNIVHRSHPHEPNKHSRLCIHEEIEELISNDAVLKKLRFLVLMYSDLRTLDFGMTPNLERLDLQGCYDLTEVHAPAGCLERLVYLDLGGCSRFRSFSFIKQFESLELFRLPNLSVHVKCLEEFPRDSSNNLPMLQFKFHYFKEQPSSTGVYLDLQPCTKLESVSGSICGLQHLRELTFHGCIPEVPKDIGQLKCLEELTLYSTHIICLPEGVCMLKHLKSLSIIDCLYLEELPENLGWLECLETLNLLSTGIRSLPDSICMLKHLQYLNLESCQLLEKLPEDIGQLECLEELNLKKCASLRDIPNSICKMKFLTYFYLPFCSQVQKLPEEFGSLECLEELDINCTGISHLPQSISSMEGLCIVGSEALLKSCAFATEIETSETKTFGYIQTMDNTSARRRLGNQFT
ncbi:unnamed protein product [Lactuca virosa]|uniref:TIR domain-containing protein n=1 Tax=Lactuca virosa TaxID=75947 RepID=A0AAU9LV53_9ASTR|nr:unnamed protein product [Lactuca virosa]